MNIDRPVMLSSKSLFHQVSGTLLAASGCISEANAEAKALLRHCLGIHSLDVVLNKAVPVTPSQLVVLRQQLGLRVVFRLPLQYGMGLATFRQFSLQVTPCVLCPRPETEELVELLLQHLQEAEPLNNPGLTILEVGTGSGAIAISLKHELPLMGLMATVLACDVCPNALAVAKRNSRQCLPVGLEASEPVLFFESDLLSALPAVLAGIFRGKVDVLVANLPYISPAYASSLQPEVLSHEPHKALFAQNEGKALILALLRQATAYLNPGASVWLELSPEQIDPLQAPITAMGYTGVQAFKALNGQLRFLKAMWPA